MPTLNAQLSGGFRDAVKAECDRINQRRPRPGAPKRQAPEGGFGPYSAAFTLNRTWLAQLVHERHPALGMSLEDIELIFKPNCRLLPVDLDLRQRFLQAVEDELSRCAQIAGKIAPTLDFTRTFLGAEPKVYQLSPFDSEDLGFFRISTWNPARPMVEDRNVAPIEIVDWATELTRHGQREDWIRDHKLFDRLLAEAQAEGMGSPCPALVSYEVDDREQDPRSEQLHLKVSRSVYSRHVALRNYMRADKAAYEAIRNRILHGKYTNGRQEGLRRIIRSAPRSNIAINVTVQSRTGTLMVIGRPTGQRVWADFHQAGAHETMNWPAPQEDVEWWFKLARRALKEEIGLTDRSDYYDHIVFSWFGFYALEASAYFFAHVRTRLSEQQLVDAVRASSGRIEADTVTWIPVTAESRDSVIDTWKAGPWEEDAEHDSAERRWLPHSALSLTELLRVSEQGMMDPPEADS
ncbi:hypothetical protein OG241_50130 [Streptomyces sp. NBC_01390]|uniref:hypothetical protein n=1 Tax=Streptomyces sp. NBC_01390 TaxID=2903850 RepID=UPI00324E3470